MVYKVWDAPTYDGPAQVKYSSARLSIIFNKEFESNKDSKYSLGKLSVAGQKLYNLPSYKISALTPDGYNLIPDYNDPDLTIGKVTKEGKLWKYISSATYSNIDSAEPQSSFIYYTADKLKSVGAGRVINNLIIDGVASISYGLVDTPQFSKRLETKREIVVKVYGPLCKYRDACILSKLSEIPPSPITSEIFYGIISDTFKYGAAWQKYLSSRATELFENNSGLTNESLLDLYLDEIDSVHGAILLEIPSKYKRGSIDLSQEYARPIYQRLPGSYQYSTENLYTLDDISDRLKLKTDLELGSIVCDKAQQSFYKYLPRRIKAPEEKYKYGLDPLDPDQVNSPADPDSWVIPAEPPSLPVTEWLTAGADLFLSNTKEKIDQFFFDILDPRTCEDSALDWIRQFFGFTDGLWQEYWSADEKRAVLLNAFGWYEQSLRNEQTGALTLKGQTLRGLPFSNYENIWIENSEEANFYDLVPYELDDQTLVAAGQSTYDLSAVPQYTLAKEEWSGLHESKGTMVNLMWWLSNFKVCRANLENELDFNYKTLSVYDTNALDRQGIEERSAQTSTVAVYRINTRMDASQSNSLTRPVTLSQPQAAYATDLSSYANPLIAGITPIYTEPYTIIPVSYKYSRNDEIWDKLAYVIENWSPVFINIRPQYPYAAADYAIVGDVFFEPPTVT